MSFFLFVDNYCFTIYPVCAITKFVISLLKQTLSKSLGVNHFFFGLGVGMDCPVEQVRS
jgi:hypothetical protein